MKPIFGVLVVMALFTDSAMAASPTTSAPNEAPAAKSAESAAEALSDEDLSALAIEAADLEAVMKELPATMPARRDMAVFLAIVTRRFQVLGLSGMANPIAFRESDRAMSRALSRVKHAAPALAKVGDQGERLLQAYRLIHVGGIRSQGFPEIDQWLGIPVEAVKAEPRTIAEPRTYIADSKAVVARMEDLALACFEAIEPGAPPAKSDRTAPIYSAPLIKLQLFAGDPMVVAKQNVIDRLQREYGVRHGNDYFFLAEEPDSAPKYLVQYESPEIGPVTSSAVAPEEQTAGVDWKGQVAIRPKSVRVYDSRRPAGQRWKVEKGTEGLTFRVSRERGVYYVDAVDRGGDHAPAALMTVDSNVRKALEDK